MNPSQFENALKADGYGEIETKSLPPKTHTDAHHHPFDVKALVLDGQISLTVDGQSRAYRVGEVFTMPAGCKHGEDVGADGVRYVVGRRRAAGG